MSSSEKETITIEPNDLAENYKMAINNDKAIGPNCTRSFDLIIDLATAKGVGPEYREQVLGEMRAGLGGVNEIERMCRRFEIACAEKLRNPSELTQTQIRNNAEAEYEQALQSVSHTDFKKYSNYSKSPEKFAESKKDLNLKENFEIIFSNIGGDPAEIKVAAKVVKQNEQTKNSVNGLRGHFSSTNGQPSSIPSPAGSIRKTERVPSVSP